MGRFRIYTDAEKRRVLRRYRKALARGATPTAASRRAGVSIEALRRWIDEEAAPVAVVKQRQCLRCETRFKSTHPGNRLCGACSGAIAALPAGFS